MTLAWSARVGGRVDEADHLHAAHDLVEIAAAGRLDLGDDVDRAEPRRRLALGDPELAAELAEELRLAPASKVTCPAVKTRVAGCGPRARSSPPAAPGSAA
jgi:hypothetical protein